MALKITGTNTAAAPGITGDDTDTGLFYASDVLGFSTGGTERLRIAASGQIGIAGANYGSSGQVLTSAGSGGSVAWSTPSSGPSLANDANNRVITGTGSGLNGEANLTFDGSILNVITTGNDAALFESTAGGANGVQLSLRATSASPADDDKLGILDFSGKDDAGNNTTYAQIRSHSRDVTNNSEDGDITFHTRSDGSFGERLRIASDGHLNQTIGADGLGFNQTAAGNNYIDDVADSNRSYADGVIWRKTANWNGKTVAQIKTHCGADTTNKDDGYITFYTSSANNNTERLRITSDGWLKYTGTRTGDETNKLGRFLMPSHDTNEEDVMYFQMQQEGSFNQLELGGGSSTYNAATQIIFRTAAIDTVAGAERLRINSTGSVQLNADGGSANFSVGAAQDFKIYHDANGPTIFSDTNNQGLKVAVKELKVFEYSGVTERLRIASDGKVNIGTTTSWLDKVTIKNNVSAGTHNWALHLLNGTHASDSRVGIAFQGNNATAANTWDGAGIYAANDGSTGACHMHFGTVVNGSFTERLRIESDGDMRLVNGDFNIGNSDTTGGHLFVFGKNGNSEPAVIELHGKNSSGGGNPKAQVKGVNNTYAWASDLRFFTQDHNINLTEHFRIDFQGNLTATDTTIGSISDSRLKTNIANYTYDLAKFKQFQPKTFDWKNPVQHGDKSGVRGFLAQDLESVDSSYVSSYLVETTVTKGNEDGTSTTSTNPDLQYLEADGIAKSSKFGPKDAMYVSVINQLISKIEALETKVAALEAT